MSPPSAPRSPSSTGEAAAAALLLIWRVSILPPSLIWSDWFSILCAFWIVTALGGRTRAWPFVAGATMIGLLLLYGLRLPGSGS